MIVQSFEENKADLDNFIANKNDNVDKIIEKWRKLQNIIKEELTLEELISKIQKKGFEQLIFYYNFLILKHRYDMILFHADMSF